jgi:hypothetical protein
MAKDVNNADVSLSDRLRRLSHGGRARLSLGEMVDQIEGDAGIGPILLILTLPVMLPLPPGASMIMALPILIVAPQIVVGRRKLWLPDVLRRREIELDELEKLIKRVLPPVEKVEAVVRPRLSLLVSGLGRRLVGAACTLIGVILVLPVPFANLLPSWALAAFSLGLTRKDGLFVLAGYGLMIAAAGVIGLGLTGVTFGVEALGRLS